MPKTRKTKKKTVKNKGFVNILRNRFGVTPLYLMLLILLSAVALVVIISNVDNGNGNGKKISINFKSISSNNNKADHLKKFTSVEDFTTYLQDSEGLDNIYAGTRNIAMPTALDDKAIASESSPMDGSEKQMPDRISETNVQVSGIDEPDILKTNGNQIFFSDTSGGYWRAMPEPFVNEDISLPQMSYSTKIFNAWPPEDLALDSEIDTTGDLLLSGNTLVVFSYQKIYGYDVSDPKNVTKKWELKLGNNTTIVNSRLYNNKLYLISQTSLNRYRPCPIVPLTVGQDDLNIVCTDIYHPINPSPVDATFVAMDINPANGKIENKVSFLGSAYSSVVYMSNDYLYVTYNDQIDTFKFMLSFLNSKASDLVPQTILAKLNKLDSYDISSNSKMTEMQTLLDEWMSSASDDELLKIQNELENRANKYFEENKRQMYATGIVKIDLDKLNIKANGSVPGSLLNQFSMDEYDGHLRVATTIGNNRFFGMSGSVQSANDVYILDKNMNLSGSITDLGMSERIYSARFIGKVGYLVTFRQTDPFYVLDLSDNNNPKMVGELKIPGYSSYLHPISENRVLGVGMEGGQVKISYFDVSNPANPQEIDKYSLSDYGSDALYNHHAFLMDSKHQIFFLPSYKGGYIFSYADDKLELVRAVSANDVKRALYLNDYMYIVAGDYMAILDENNWDKVNDLDF